MISRLTACATAFALAGTTALAFTAEAEQRPAAPAAAVHAVRIIELPGVVVVGHRASSAAATLTSSHTTIDR